MPESVAPDLSNKARPLARYLRNRVRAEGELYVKSRFVADEVDLSAKEIGAYMPRIDGQTDLTVEAWAYTNGTTWRVAREQ